MPGRRTLLGMIAACVCGTILMTAGWFSFAGSDRGGDDLYLGYGADPQLFVWFINWFVFASHHHLPLFWTRYVAAPSGMDLAWRTSIPALALLSAPLTSAKGALVSYNLLMRAAPGLFGVGLLFASRSLGAGWVAACASALLGVFSAYETGQSLAHVNLSFVACVPVLAGLAILAARRNWAAWRLALPAGSVLAVQIGISQEVAATTALFAVAAMGCLWWRRPDLRRRLARVMAGLSAALGVAILLASPLLWPMLFGGRRGDTVIPYPSAFSTDLLNLVVPGDTQLFRGGWSRALGGRFTGNASENAGYLGLPLIGLLVWIRWRGRSAAASLLVEMGLVAAVLSLGPRLHVAGMATGLAPWALVSWLPILHDMLPVRFMLYADCAWAMAVACWLSDVARWDRTLAGLAVALSLIVLLPDRTVLGHWEPLRRLPVLADVPDGSAVFLLPYRGDHVGAQVASGMRFRLVGQGYLGGGLVRPFSRWPLIGALYDARYGSVDRHELADFLQLYGVDRVVVEHDREPDWKAADDLLLGAGWHPVARAGADELFAAAGPRPGAAHLLLERDAYLGQGMLRTRTRREGMNVCAIRRLEHRIGLHLGVVWNVYRRLVALPVPPDRIECRAP